MFTKAKERNSDSKKATNPLSDLVSSILQHEYLVLYVASLPLSGIFLLDVLPSRLSLVLLGQMSGNIYYFDALFLAYSFTNFFGVFVLSLSCGLDTMDKIELRHGKYYRYAMVMVSLGLGVYLIAVLKCESILTHLGQPTQIIAQVERIYLCIYIIFVCIELFEFALVMKSHRQRNV
ncbi:hypothetical protein RFI_28004 [Reticulomyxa filosa]|uniref:Uncharacterized protein n=1 Tax=Reticulomyxa filosa TaxID=46433 RepID=X6M6Z7_RETFI|nr:hypothetical protein RFI_28004 [Reticulomyxa filosa]|eukprot:ETO09371.1 hypothetical protein RFI_28004 [Reticulomyxa filosa]